MKSSLAPRVIFRCHRPNIQMQMTGAGTTYQSAAILPASDLERYVIKRKADVF